ncbi:hypothetical protein AX16_004074 [Volvariella volvacea WC 439]|nr:hypothetical protein AX16_004074 [Volvariella volvacea WC 439]
MVEFGYFNYFCENTPSYPWCNLFYRQLQRRAPSLLLGVSADPDSAPVGINPECGIPRAGHNNSPSNVVNNVFCFLCTVWVGVLMYKAVRRKIAFARIEFRVLLALYGLSLLLQLLTIGSFLKQGSTSLVVITAVHLGILSTTFWALFAFALVIFLEVLQLEERSLNFPFIALSSGFLGFFVFAASGYVGLDIGFGFSEQNQPGTPWEKLRSVPLFIFAVLWPLTAIAFYLAVVGYLLIWRLRDFASLRYLVLSFTLFAVAQVDYFILSGPICDITSARLDGSFIATFLNTASLTTLYLSWKVMTED